MTKLDPGEAFYHNDTHIMSAGGTYGDSTEGTRDAAAKGFHRIDNNFSAVRRGLFGLEPVNAHGKPFNPSFIKGKWTSHWWKKLHKNHPGVRDAEKTFRDAKDFLGPVAKKKGVNEVVEGEVKDLHPYARNPFLGSFFKRLRAAAQAVWGDEWQKHVVIKVLTNLRGGEKYALKILKHAHKYGFTTMVLPRDAAARKVIDEPYIDLNRGGRV